MLHGGGGLTLPIGGGGGGVVVPVVFPALGGCSCCKWGRVSGGSRVARRRGAYLANWRRWWFRHWVGCSCCEWGRVSGGSRVA